MSHILYIVPLLVMPLLAMSSMFDVSTYQDRIIIVHDMDILASCHCQVLY
jgi:hypothetical protein